MKLRWSIRDRLNAVLGLCALLFVVIAAPLISYFSYQTSKDAARQQQLRLVEAVKPSAAIAIFVENKSIADEVLDGLLQNDEILAAELVGIDNEVLFTLSKPSEDIQPNSPGLSTYNLYSPVDENTRIGLIRIMGNEQLILARSKKLVQKDVALLVGISVLLSLVLMLAANKLVATPLRDLSKKLSQASPGSKERIEVSSLHRFDEIGLVAHSVNSFLSVTRDAIDNERQLRHQLQKMNQHFSNIFASSHVGIMVLDELGTLLQHNPVLFDRLVELTEEQKRQLNDIDFFALIFKSPEAAWDLVDSARTSCDTVSSDLELKSSWNSPCWVHCLLTVNQDPDTNSEIIEVVLYDVTSRVQETETARQQAEIDPLTKLKNRRGCENFLQQRFRRREAKMQLVAMLLDLDGFKPINDQYGHAAGDEVLKIIAKRLRDSIRTSTDLAGRLGGDEFVLFMKIKERSQQKVTQIAAKIQEKCARPIQLSKNVTVNIGVSVGIAYAADYDSAESMLDAADNAMYRVKAKGKNNFAFAGR